MRRYHLFLILMIISSAASAQLLSRSQADSLLSTLKQPLCDTCRANTLIAISDFLLHQRRISSLQLDSVNNEMAEAAKINQPLHLASINNRLMLAQALLYKATDKKQAGQQTLAKLIMTLEKEGDQLLLAKAYYELSDFFSGDFLQSTMDTRIRYLEQSIQAYKKTHDRLSLARDYRFLADLHLMSNAFGEAFVEANTALTLYNAVGYKDNQGVLALLGRLYFAQENYKEAVDYQLMALDKARKSKQDNVRLICQINNNLGSTFLELNDLPNALRYYAASIAIAENEKDNATIYMLAANVVDAYLKAGRGAEAVTYFEKINRSFAMPKQQIYEAGDFGISKTFLKIYIALGQFDKAWPYYERVVKESGNPNINLYSLSEYNELIARANIGVHNYKLAALYLKKNEKLLLSIKDYSGLAVNYRLKAALDTVQGDYSRGMRHILIAQKIQDSLFNAMKSSQVEQLQVAYLTSEKESQISLLQQKSSMEQVNLQKSNLIRNFSLGGTAGLFVIASLLYRQNRRKKHNNQLMVKSNQRLGDLVAEKEWLLKEVHHRVKNNLHTVICLLESQASFLADEALHAVESSRCRIYAMSLIHQKFYQSENIRSIEIKSYISELMVYLQEIFGYPDHIHTYVDVPEIHLSVSKAIPVGLIINEAVNNAYKYAFPNKREGKINISLQAFETIIRLEISDNGIGIPFDPGKDISDSLGIELMKGLATDLKGDITFLRGAGTGIIVTFEFDPVPGGLQEVLYA